MAGSHRVRLLAWTEDDYWAVERFLTDANMMEHLGGVQSIEQVQAQQERYLNTNASGKGQMFKIVLGAETEAIGNIGYWERDWGGEMVFETGWMVLLDYQGKGYASAALELLLDRLRVYHRYRFLHAFPAVSNLPSNALCRKAGFSWLRKTAFEYAGHTLECNDWFLDLGQPGGAGRPPADGAR